MFTAGRHKLKQKALATKLTLIGDRLKLPLSRSFSMDNHKPGDQLTRTEKPDVCANLTPDLSLANTKLQSPMERDLKNASEAQFSGGGNSSGYESLMVSNLRPAEQAASDRSRYAVTTDNQGTTPEVTKTHDEKGRALSNNESLGEVVKDPQLAKSLQEMACTATMLNDLREAQGEYSRGFGGGGGGGGGSSSQDRAISPPGQVGKKAHH